MPRAPKIRQLEELSVMCVEPPQTVLQANATHYTISSFPPPTAITAVVSCCVVTKR